MTDGYRTFASAACFSSYRRHDGIDDDVTASCSPPSGGAFALGATAVSCTATDTSGNAAHLDFTVQVNPAAPSVPAAPPWSDLLLAGLLAALGLAATRISRPARLPG